jgi:hypothetical protein
MRPRQNCILAMILFTALAMAGVASGQERAQFLWGPGEPKFTTGAGVDRATVAAMALLPAISHPLTTWNGSFIESSTDYLFTMVGKDPSLGAKTTTIRTLIVPVIFSFADTNVLDPTKKVCGGTGSALKRTQASPIFHSFNFPTGPTVVGKTQYTDAFQRANFWSEVSTTSPKYHVMISKGGRTPVFKVNVPSSEGSTVSGPCARIGLVEINWFDSVVVPAILAKFTQIKPNVLPIFLNYNTFLYDTVSSNCCILGYHNAGATSQGIQTYAEATFNDPGIFSGGGAGIQDVMALGHEVAEWMDDPFVNNAAPPWGELGQVSGCQSDLEVGDALTGTVFTEIGSSHFTYHLQDLTFLPFFSRVTPSASANGWYSFIGTFKTSSAGCPPGGLAP